jgi:HD superfamily phosphohydrolase
MANLEIGAIKTGVDEEAVGEIETFVLGPKAYYAAETYVLALFQLYPTIYFHKATRAAEKLFSLLILRIISLVRDGHSDKTGLPPGHAIIRFADDPESLDNAASLDDAVFWGSLHLLVDAADTQIQDCATRLRDRRLPKCLDLRHRLASAIELDRAKNLRERDELKKKLERLIISIEKGIDAWTKKQPSAGAPLILMDRAERDPYRRFQESKGPLNQIHIRLADGQISDVASCSSVIAAVETFELFRAYTDDDNGRRAVEDIVRAELARG